MKQDTQLSGGTFCGSKVITRLLHHGEIVTIPCNEVAKRVGNPSLSNIVEVYIKGATLLHHIGGYNKEDEEIAITKKDIPKAHPSHHETPNEKEDEAEASV
jgi:hypothetical protein